MARFRRVSVSMLKSPSTWLCDVCTLGICPHVYMAFACLLVRYGCFVNLFSHAGIAVVIESKFGVTTALTEPSFRSGTLGAGVTTSCLPLACSLSRSIDRRKKVWSVAIVCPFIYIAQETVVADADNERCGGRRARRAAGKKVCRALFPSDCHGVNVNRHGDSSGAFAMAAVQLSELEPRAARLRAAELLTEGLLGN
ncbi:hypothetical protein EVAR_7781_1 [Eumeta japonica]|uniref:Uncharacterized protein n=1 Tax=Eumeta variegata TaxID=151549 RepID=A0A4C1TJ36_EUMVA|nr:hypothetical protein EVAR_7781_1 [Eumeta japonica]